MEEDAEFSDPQIEAILLFEGNNKCNDCDEQNPKWTSINNAVFLCAKCARKHKKYPKNVSLIKSLEVDDFNKGEILLLRQHTTAPEIGTLTETCLALVFPLKRKG